MRFRKCLRDFSHEVMGGLLRHQKLSRRHFKTGLILLPPLVPSQFTRVLRVHFWNRPVKVVVFEMGKPRHELSPIRGLVNKVLMRCLLSLSSRLLTATFRTINFILQFFLLYKKRGCTINYHSIIITACQYLRRFVRKSKIDY